MLERNWGIVVANWRLIVARLRANVRDPWIWTRSLAISLAVVLGAQASYYLYDAAQERYAHQNYQPARDARVPIVVKGQAEPKPYQPNCEKPQSREDSDLCAQWAGVTQVTETNRLASLGLLMGISTLIATIFGSALLVWTLYETRQTARRELRAYVSVELVGFEFNVTEQKATATIRLTNGGQTPAYLCCHNGNIYAALDDVAEHDIMRRPKVNIGRAQPFTLHMNEPQMGTIYAHDKISIPDLKEIVEGEKWLYAYGTVFYRDTFGIDRETRFCIKTDDIDLRPPSSLTTGKAVARRADFLMAPFHNDST